MSRRQSLPLWTEKGCAPVVTVHAMRMGVKEPPGTKKTTTRMIENEAPKYTAHAGHSLRCVCCLFGESDDDGFKGHEE